MSTTVTTPDPEPTDKPSGESAPGQSETETQPGTKTAPATSEGDDLLDNATAEELAEIDKNPVLSKIRKSMTRNYKAKTTSVAERMRALEEREAEAAESLKMHQQAVTLLDTLREHPAEMIKALATRHGLTIAEAKQEIKAAETDQELVELFGEQAAEVQPRLDKIINKRVEARLAPVLERLSQADQQQLSRDISTELKSFRNELIERGEDVTPEIEKEMLGLMDEIEPAIDPTTGQYVSIGKYVRRLYAIATGQKTRSQVTKEVTERIQRNVREIEPRDLPTSGSGASSPITEKMSLRESLRAVRPQVRSELGRGR